MGEASLQAKPKDIDLHIGIDKRDNAAIADVLAAALSDSFSLYVKTLGVHWNIVGPGFFGLHKLTEEQYQDLGLAIDATAERMRALGHIAPAAFGDFAEKSCIDSRTTIASAENMLKELIADNESIARRLRKAVDIADKGDDVFTADFLTARIGQHEKNVWMLKSITT